MRPISTADDAILDSEDRRVLWRVLVTYHGSQVDLSAVGAVTSGAGTRPGTSFLESASWGETVDDVQMSATITVSRKVEQMNLAPLVTASRLNAVPSTYAYDPLLALSRAVELQWALVTDATASSPTWRRAFTGYIDRVSPSSDTITIECRSNSRLLQKQIRRERVYAYSTSAGKGMYLWQASTAYAVGDLVVPTDAKAAVGKYYTCTVAGTSGSAEPTWPTSGTVTSGGVTFSMAGSTTTSTGTALETVMQQMITDNLGSGVVTLALGPTGSPGWAVRYFLQRREVLLDALRTLALQRGWDARDKWDETSGAFRFTLYEPQRTKTTPDYTLPAGWMKDLSPVAQDITTVRNWIRVYYYDSQDKDAGGTPKRKYVEATDTSSSAQHGELYMEISEAYSSHIDTSTEAQTLANAARDDLSTPFAERVAPLHFFPFCELGDLYRFEPDEFHDTNLDLAVIGYRHELSQDGGATTTLTCRGKPAGANRLWFKLAAFPGYNDNSQDVQQNTGAGLSVSATATIKGARLTVTVSESKSSVLDGFEWHVSTTSGYTPDSTTLVSKGASRSLELSDRTPGTTYYVRVVSYGTSNGKLVRGEPTAEVSFTPLYIEPRAMQPRVAYTALNLNPDFEAQNNTSAPPDGWSMLVGTWGSDATVTSDALGGNNALNLAGADVQLVSAPAVARPGLRYSVDAFAKGSSGASVDVFVEWLDASLTALGTGSASSSRAFGAGATYSRMTATAVAPSTARYVRARIRGVTSGTQTVQADSVAVTQSDTPQEAGAGVTFIGTWDNYTLNNCGPVRYYKDSSGRVHVEGHMKGGTTGTVAFVLPSTARPQYNRYFPLVTDTGFGWALVSANGEVYVMSGGTTWVSLGGVSFRAA